MAMGIQKIVLCSLILLEISSVILAPNVALAIPLDNSNIRVSTNSTPANPQVKTIANQTGTLTSSPSPIQNTTPDNIFLIPAQHPDKNYEGSQTHKKEQELKQQKELSETSDIPGTQPKFDDKAVQRALVVTAVLAAILLVYFGVKFAYLKKRKVNKRYGRIESEIDLLDEAEDGDTEEEDDTLFDINSTRRSQF